MITGEYRQKRLAKGGICYYTYYRCTKKHKTIDCNEAYVREEELDKQISTLLENIALPPEWAKELRGKLTQDRNDAAISGKELQDKTESTIREIQMKLERLLDSFLAQDVEREIYLRKKADLLSQKKSLEEKLARLKHSANAWLEPMEKWLNQAESLKKTAQDSDLFAKKVTAKEIFGSNLLLTQKNVVVVSPKNVVNVVGKNVVDPSENVVGVRKNVDQNVVGGGYKTQWAALSAARAMASKKPLCLVMVPGVRIELTTQGSSGLRSTTELPRLMVFGNGEKVPDHSKLDKKERRPRKSRLSYQKEKQ